MSETRIHPTALIGDRVRIGPGATIDAYAVIEDDVELGANCRIGCHCVVHRFVRMGADNQVFPQAVLGGLPQDLSFDPAVETWLEIGAGNLFREGVTVSRGSAATALTRIGSAGFFMSNSHVGHDCRVGDNVIIASGAALGGHVEVDDAVFLGGGAMVHQFCRIGALAIVSGLAGVRKDVLPYSMLAGEPARHFRLNTIGLRRAGIGGDALQQLSRAYRTLRDGDRQLTGVAPTAQIAYLRAWLAAPSKRGLSPYVRAADQQRADG